MAITQLESSRAPAGQRGFPPRHEQRVELTPDEFVAKLNPLKARGESMFWNAFPFADRITVEFRKHNPGATGIPNRAAWILGNYLWGTAGPPLWPRRRRTFPIRRFATR